jgi:hypothetical protein
MKARAFAGAGARAVVLAGLAVWLWGAAAGAADRVSFASGMELVVKKVEEKENVVVLHLLEGGQIAVPREVVVEVKALSQTEAMEAWERARQAHPAAPEGEPGLQEKMEKARPGYESPVSRERDRDDVTPAGIARGGGGMVPTTRDAFLKERPNLVTSPSSSGQHGPTVRATEDMVRRLSRGVRKPALGLYGREYWMGDSRQKAAESRKASAGKSAP